jgi:amino acid transporter
MTLLTRYYQVLGRPLVAALAYCEKNTPDVLPVGSGFMLMVGSIVPRGFIGGLAVVSFFLWYFLLVIVMIQVCARNLFAWSLDGVAPSWFKVVSTKNAVPKNCLVTVVAIGGGFALLVSFNLINFVNYVALFVACYLLTGVAAIILPWKRPDLLAAGSQLTRPKRSVSMRIVSLGVANTVIFGMILFVSLTSSDFSGVPATKWPFVFLVVVYVAGFVLYWLSRRGGAALDRELRVQLPPE